MRSGSFQSFALLLSLLGTACGGAETAPPPAGPSDGTPASTRGQCGLTTGFVGDDACLLAPDPSEGIQIHVGPTDYSDPAEVAKFTMAPGDESSECWSFHTPNDEKLFYQSFELSGRPGTHHIIDTMYGTEIQDGGFTACRDGGVGFSPDIIGSLPGASRPYTPRAAVAPENEHVASSIPAHASAQADMHYYNLTSKPILREFWLNVYQVDAAKVTTQSNGIRGMGGLSWLVTPIPPQTHQTYAYTCPIPTDGRIIELLGHTHAHGVRETAWIRSASGDRTKVFEQYDYKEPAIFYYDSVTKNPDFSTTTAGATSGVLDVKAGSFLDWECEVNNDSNKGLTYTNEVQTGEMCNIWGQSIGPLINCVLQ